MSDYKAPPSKTTRYNLRSSTTKLFDLNDDCLDEIFGHLDAMELCSVRQVCKRFRQLTGWHFKRKFSAFDFSTLFADQFISSKKARNVLRNFGHLMKSVTISRKALQSHETTGYVEERLLEDIVTYCGKTLHQLKVKNFLFTSQAVDTLNMLSSLQSLSLIEFVLSVDFILYLPNFSSLTHLEITIARDCYALAYVFPALEYLRLDYVCISNNNILANFIVTHKQLKTLIVRRCKGIPSDVFRWIGVHLVNLEELYYVKNLMDRSESIERSQKNIQHLSELKKLQRFTWHCSVLSIGNLLTKMMSNQIALKSFCFADAPVDDETIKAIKEMKSLKCLCFHQTNGLRNEHLMAIAMEVTQLNELFIGWQPKITFDVFKNVLRHTKQLYRVQIGSRTYPLDRILYNEILDIVKERRNGIKLTITIDSADVQDVIPQRTININKNWLVIQHTAIFKQFF